MLVLPGSIRDTNCAGQACVKNGPFSVSVPMVCVSAVAIVTVVSISCVETGASALVFLCALLLFALLLTSLTLTGLARLRGLQRLVGLTTGLATNTVQGEKTG